MDTAGNLFGTTAAGGDMHCVDNDAGGCGTVYKLAPDGKETVLHAFAGGDDGYFPSGKLHLDSKGNLYGITEGGGGTGCGGYGCGTVFEIATDGSESVLSDFNEPGGPSVPVGGVITDSKGNLFGTTYEGSASGCGTVYTVAPGGVATAIYSFKCGADGANPETGLKAGKDKLYGTTSAGGNGYGVVFSVRR